MRLHGWSPRDRIKALIRRGRDQSAPPPIRGRREQGATARRAFTRYRHPDLGRPASRTRRNKHLLFNPAVCSICYGSLG